MRIFSRFFLVLSLAVVILPTTGVCSVEIFETYSDSYSPLAIYLVFGGDTVLVKLDVTTNLRGAGLAPSKLAVIWWQGGGYRMLPNTSEFNKDSTVFMQCLTGSPSDTSTRANTYKVNQKGDCQYICQTNYFSALVNEFENGNILVVDSYGFDAGKYVVRTHVVCKGITLDSNFPVKRSYDYGWETSYGPHEHGGEYDMFQFITPDTILFVAGHNVPFMIYGGGASWSVVADTTVLKFNSVVGVQNPKHQIRSLPLINTNGSFGQSFDVLGRKINASLESHSYPGVRITKFGNGFETRVSVK